MLMTPGVAAATVQDWPRGATPHPRSAVAAERSYPTLKVRETEVRQ